MILIICGSPRSEGQTSQALRLLDERLQHFGVERVAGASRFSRCRSAAADRASKHSRARAIRSA